MSHPNTDTDERVSTAPERYWLIPSNWGFIPSTTKPTKSEGIEYERADIAATRMRDRCVVHLQATADALDVRQETECPSGTAFNSEAILRRRIAIELQSLTLEVKEKQ